MNRFSTLSALALAAVLSEGALGVNCSSGRRADGNVCPHLTSWVASPLQTSVGGIIEVGAAAAGPSTPPNTLTFAWTPTGNFTAPTAATTQYHCTAPGVRTITVTVSDNRDASPCTAAVSMDVTCAIR